MGAYEAKTHLPALLKRVASGEEITITKHGAPIARLVPIEHSADQHIGDVLDDLLAHRLTVPEGESAREWLREGRG